jgi:hypothetical protein
MMYSNRAPANWLSDLLYDPLIITAAFLTTLVPTTLLGWGVFVGCRIQAEGVPTVATLTFGGPNGNPAKNRCSTYHVDYAFSPPGCAERLRPYWLHRTVRATVPEEIYDRARSSGKIPIRYVPDRPQWNLPQQCRTTNMLVILLVVCLGFNTMAACTAVLAIFLRRSRQRLFGRQQWS